MTTARTQAPRAVVMVRPHRFRPNPATRADNAFQRKASASRRVVAAAAYREVSVAAQVLADAGVRVHLFEDDGDGTPDSVFPNNWFSTHGCGNVALYPMCHPNRRTERRRDIIDMLELEYEVGQVVDYSGLEHHGVFLEGTGAMVLDHLHRVAYVSSSARASSAALHRFCIEFGYVPVVFDAAGPTGEPIYHTNVLMSVGTDVALVGLGAISSVTDRDRVRQTLEATGRAVVELTPAQVGQFAGNSLELTGAGGPLLAMSARARRSLTPGQLDALESVVTVLPLAVPTIELAGGSVRCMLAGVHLPPKVREPRGDLTPTPGRRVAARQTAAGVAR